MTFIMRDVLPDVEVFQDNYLMVVTSKLTQLLLMALITSVTQGMRITVSVVDAGRA